MKKSEIIKVSLEIAFGNKPSKSLQGFINRAIDQGEYYEGFEIAIGKNNLDYQEYEELLASFNSAYENSIPDMEKMSELFDKYLPQAYSSTLSWLVSDLGEIFATDGLQVAKIHDGNLIWRTPRVSWDGINLLKLSENEIIGEWYSPIDENSPWSELRISMSDGALIVGEEIEY